MYEKIAQIQKEIGKLKKDTEGYGYKYFDINQLLDHLLPELEKHNLTLIQPVDVDVNGNNILKTVLTDNDDGTNEVTNIRLPNDVKPQDMGSAITYYRRYSLVSLFALRAEDDDGATAQHKGSGNKKVDEQFDL